MHPVQQHLFDTDFKDLAGSRLQGTIVLSEDLINMGIMDFVQGLQQETAPPAPSAPAAAPEKTPTPDPKALLAKLDINTLRVRAEAGRFLLEVDVALK